MEDKSNPDTNDIVPHPEISDLNFLEGDSKDKFAIEFLVNNPTSTQVLIKQATIQYWDGIMKLYFTPPPVYKYELAIQLDTNASRSNLLLVNGTARESMDDWGRPVSGAVHITRGDKINILFSFPIYLGILPKEQGIIRLIMKQPQLILKNAAKLDEEGSKNHDPSWILRELSSWTYRHGDFQVQLNGDFEKPIVKRMGDNRFLKYICTLSTKTETTNESPSQSLHSILFLAADPNDASRLRLGEELREIQEKLKLSKLRNHFKLELPQLSVRPVDISQALLDIQPQIVHFSGHGSSTGALCFENQSGKIHFVQPDALASLFEQFANQVNCVILNACYSETQAIAIAEHIEYVIGMNQAIGDKAAIAFAIGFYQALGAGKSIEDAYKLGCVQIRLQNIPEHLTPVLIKKGQVKQ